MKRLFLLGLALSASSTVLLAMPDASSRVVVRETVKQPLTEAARLARKNAVKPALTPAKADEDEIVVTVNVDIDDDGWDEFCNLIAVRIVDGVPEVHQCDLGMSETLWEDETVDFPLPPGVYDFLAVGHTEREEPEIEGTFIIVKENVDINTTQELTFRTEDANLHTVFERRGPDGELIDFEGRGEVSIMIDYKGFEIYQDQISLMVDGFPDLFLNKVSDLFTVTRMDLATSAVGTLSYVQKVDFSKETIGATAEGWQSAEMDFSPTPVDAIIDSWAAESSKNKKSYFMKYSTMVIGERISTSGLVLDNENVVVNKVWSWTPEGYDNRYEYLLFPTGNVASASFFGAMFGLPFRRSDSGDAMYQVGRNFMNQSKMVNSLTYSEESVNLNPGNPRYSGVVEKALLCNSTPALVLLPFPNGNFEYDYIGRYGEDMTADAANFSTEIKSSTLKEALGSKSPSDINIKVDDTEYVTSRAEFAKFKYTAGKYEVSVTMDNVKIDGEVPGVNKTVMAFDTTEGQNFPPTLTALQFRDKEDKVSDRFEEADGTLEFFAADFTSQSHKSPSYAYATTSPIKNVEVSWSPSGKDEWQAMEVVEIPELFFMPGFGYCYRGNLSQVNTPSDNKWYDLKIRLADESGAYQEQILTSAFRIEKVDPTGVGAISVGYDNSAVKIYNINGSIVASDTNSSLAPGIYIVREGDKCRKMIVK